MKQSIVTVACMCMLAAICSQFMSSGGYVRSLRLVLGLEIFRCGLKLAQELTGALV